MTIQKILLGYEPKKENLLRVIKEINKEFGFFSVEATQLVARHFGMKDSEVYSAASFYDQIRKKNKNDVLIQVCDGISCASRRGEEIIREVENLLHQKADDDFNPKVKIERISCIGKCLDGPIMIVNGTVFERVVPGRATEILRSYLRM